MGTIPPFPHVSFAICKTLNSERIVEVAGNSLWSVIGISEVTLKM
jgi:hypothetical protein